MLKNTQWESSLTAYTMKIIATLIHTEVLHNPPSVLQPESKNIAHVFSFLRYTDAFIKLSACLYSSFSIFTYSTSLSVHPVLFSLRDQQTFIFCFPLQDQNRHVLLVFLFIPELSFQSRYRSHLVRPQAARHKQRRDIEGQDERERQSEEEGTKRNISFGWSPVRIQHNFSPADEDEEEEDEPTFSQRAKSTRRKSFVSNIFNILFILNQFLLVVKVVFKVFRVKVKVQRPTAIFSWIRIS